MAGTGFVSPVSPTDPEPGVGGLLSVTAARGGLVTLVGQVLRQVVVLGVSVILARLLSPADFGLFAIVVAVTLYLSHVTEIGLAWTLIQKPDITPSDVATALTCNVIAGAVAAAGLAATAGGLAHVLHAPRAATLLRVLAVLLPIQALTGTHRALLRRDLAFRTLAVVDVVAIGLSAPIGVLVALRTRGVASLVAMQVASVLATSAGLLLAKRSVGLARPSRASARELARFSGPQLAFESITYWGRTVDNLLLARFFGPAVLGLYSRAFTLVQLPAAQLQLVAGSVAFPILARNQRDESWLASFSAKLVSAICTLAFPFLLVAVMASDDLVRILYGTPWLGVTPYARIFLVAAMFQLVMLPPTWTMQALGLTGRMLWSGIFFACINMAMFAAAVAVRNTKWFAGAYVVSSAAAAVLNMWILGRRLRRSPRFFLRPAIAPALYAALAVVPSSLACRAVVSYSWYRPLLTGSVGVGVYAILARRRVGPYLRMLFGRPRGLTPVNG